MLLVIGGCSSFSPSGFYGVGEYGHKVRFPSGSVNLSTLTKLENQYGFRLQLVSQFVHRDRLYSVSRGIDRKSDQSYVIVAVNGVIDGVYKELDFRRKWESLMYSLAYDSAALDAIMELWVHRINEDNLVFLDSEGNSIVRFSGKDKKDTDGSYVSTNSLSSQDVAVGIPTAVAYLPLILVTLPIHVSDYLDSRGASGFPASWRGIKLGDTKKEFWHQIGPDAPYKMIRGFEISDAEHGNRELLGFGYKDICEVRYVVVFFNGHLVLVGAAREWQLTLTRTAGCYRR